MMDDAYFAPKIDAKLYTRIGKIINNKFAHRVYEDNVVEQIEKELEDFERSPAVQSIIQNMVHNRQLILEHFYG